MDMKILFTGHRDCMCDEIMLENIAALYDDYVWIHGGATGFDSQVERCAKAHNIPTEIYKPDYEKYTAKQAPIMRNIEMVGMCEKVFACYDGRKYGGTYFTIGRAQKTGKKVTLLVAHHHKSTQQA